MQGTVKMFDPATNEGIVATTPATCASSRNAGTTSTTREPASKAQIFTFSASETLGNALLGTKTHP